MSTGTCEKKFHVRKNTFKKINLNMRFFGTVSGRFSQYFFFNFSTSPSNGGQQFYSPVHPTPHLPQPATIKKLPTALLYMVVPLYYYKNVSALVTATFDHKPLSWEICYYWPEFFSKGPSYKKSENTVKSKSH